MMLLNKKETNSILYFSAAKVAEKGLKDLSTINSFLQSMRAPAKHLKLFQIMCWPQDQNVPNSTLALTHLIDQVLGTLQFEVSKKQKYV